MARGLVLKLIIGLSLKNVDRSVVLCGEMWLVSLVVVPCVVRVPLWLVNSVRGTSCQRNGRTL